MPARPPARWLVFVFAASVPGSGCPGIVACRCSNLANTDAHFGEDAAVASPRAAGEAEPASTRCHVVRGDVALGTEGDSIILGEGIMQGERLSIGAIHGRGGTSTQAIARVDFSRAPPSVEWVDLEPSIGDDPPPMPVVTASGVSAVLYRHVLEKGADARLLSVYDVGASPTGGPPRLRFDLGTDPDESLAFDVAAANGETWVAWDDLGDGGPERGSIAVAHFGAEREGTPPLVTRVSPAGTIAEAPSILVAEGRVSFVYRVRQAVARQPPKGDRALEGPGDDDVPSAVVATFIDGGIASHLSELSALPPPFALSGDEEGGLPLVVAAAWPENAGVPLPQPLFLVRSLGDPSRTPVGLNVVSTDALAVLGGLLFVEVGTERVRVIPVSGGFATDEPALSGGRPLAEFPGDSRGDRVTFAAVTASSEIPHLAVVSCTR